MGHADVETTVRWYTKPSERDLACLLDAWGDGSPEVREPPAPKREPKRPKRRGLRICVETG